MPPQLTPALLQFSRTVFILGKKYHERNLARKDLHDHLTYVKNSHGRNPKKNIRGDLDATENKIALLIEKEKKLAATPLAAHEHAVPLQRTISRLTSKLSEKNKELLELQKRSDEQTKKLEEELRHEKMVQEHLEITNKRKIEELKVQVRAIRARIKEIIGKETSQIVH